MSASTYRLGPVTASDVEQAVTLACAALRELDVPDWRAPAGALEWDCRETVEHMADDLFAYAVQLGPRNPPATAQTVPIVFESKRPGGPRSTIFVEHAAGTSGLIQVLEATGALLVAMVATAPPTLRAYHSFGIADPEGFAAMGVVEVLVHTYDLAEGLGFAWSPPAELCRRALGRLFPDAPADTDPWQTLLWATGRDSLGERPPVAGWRWSAAPRADAAVGG